MKEDHSQGVSGEFGGDAALEEASGPRVKRNTETKLP